MGAVGAVGMVGAVGGASRTGNDGRCEPHGRWWELWGKSLGKLLPLSSYLL